MTNYGRIEEVVKYPPANREVILLSRDVLMDCFQRNKELLKLVGLSMVKQREELNKYYNLRIGVNTFSLLGRGKRFRCGVLLLMTIKHYWLKKGYEFRIDCI